MRVSPSSLFTLGLAAVLAVPCARAEDVTKLDPSVRVEKLDPGPDTTKSVGNVDKQRANRIEDSRATLAGLIEEPTAPLADRRAPIELAETRAKTMIERKDAPISTDLLARKDSPLAGQTARDRFQTKTNPFTDSSLMSVKYQPGIRTAGKAVLPSTSSTGLSFAATAPGPRAVPRSSPPPAVAPRRSFPLPPPCPRRRRLAPRVRA